MTNATPLRLSVTSLEAKSVFARSKDMVNAIIYKRLRGKLQESEGSSELLVTVTSGPCGQPQPVPFLFTDLTMASQKVFVGNLAFRTTDQNLIDLFGQVGTVYVLVAPACPRPPDFTRSSPCALPLLGSRPLFLPNPGGGIL